MSTVAKCWSILFWLLTGAMTSQCLQNVWWHDASTALAYGVCGVITLTVALVIEYTDAVY